MIRLWLCIGLLGGTIAFLSCSSDRLDNGGAVIQAATPAATAGFK